MDKQHENIKVFPKINYDAVKILIGVALILLAVLGFINNTVVSGLMNYTITLFVGFFNEIVLVLVAIYGLVLILTKRAIPLDFNIPTIGIIIAAIALMGVLTQNALVGRDIALNLGNFFTEFRDLFPKFNQIPLVEGYDPVIGGGLLGYFILGLTNTIAGSDGAIFALYAVMLIGIAMSMEAVWKGLIQFLAKQAEIQKKERETYLNITSMVGPASKIPTSTIPFEKSSVSSSSEATASTTKTATNTIGVTAKPIAMPSPRNPFGTVRKAFVPTSNGLQRVLPKKPIVQKPLSSSENPSVATPSMSAAPEMTDSTKVTITPEPNEPEAIPPAPSGLETQKNLPRSTFNRTFPTKTVDMAPPAAPVKGENIDNPLLVSLRQSASDYRYADYRLPSLTLLQSRDSTNEYEINERVTRERIERIHAKFQALDVSATVVGVQIGPSVTTFDIKMSADSQASEVRRIVPDLGITLGGFTVNFNEIVPGKPVSSLEVFNEVVAMVGLKEVLSDVMQNEKTKSKLYLPFGRNIQGQVVSLTPKDIIHMLVAGSTGSGKSVFMHAFIVSILFRAKPNEIKLLLVDPKRVELSKYKQLPHLLCPIISEFTEARIALERLYIEMEDRYKILQAADCTSLDQYNALAKQKSLKPLPIIFAILDEYNDLVEAAPAISDWVQRIAQKSRAAGIHIVIATQRPTTNIVTGNVKNNMTTKVALRVAAAVDSITVLGHAGSEVLGGNGDMFLANPLFNRTGEQRVQGAYISDEEIAAVTAEIRKHYPEDYDKKFLDLVDKNAMGPAASAPIQDEDDELYDTVKEQLPSMEFISLNWITQTYEVGFNRAKMIFRRLQVEGLIESKKDNLQSNKGCRVLIYQGKAK